MAAKELVRIAEKAVQTEATRKMSSRLRESVADAGRVDSLRYTILTYVADENYDTAIEELRGYVDSKPEYPQFRNRCDRYVQHAVELVQAVRAKRSFPGWNALNMAKQRELFERAIAHFEDLKITLKKIEALEQEVRVADVKSTVVFIQVVVWCSLAVFLVAVVKEISNGVIPSAVTVVESTTSDVVNTVFDYLGL